MVCPSDAPMIRQQARDSASFSEPQGWSLERLADIVATSAGVTVQVLDNAPFTKRGGVDGAIRDLGTEAATQLDELDAELTA